MRTPYSSSFLNASSPTTLLFLPAIKRMYYGQFDKSIEERNIVDFNKTQSLISETLSKPMYALLAHFAKNYNSLLPNSQAITHQIAEDIKLANLVRYSSFNANLKKFASSVNNSFFPNPAQMRKFFEAHNISHSAIIELVLKLCACANTQKMRASKFSTSAHYAVKNIFELVSVDNAFENYTDDETIIDDDVVRCREYITSFFKNFDLNAYLNYRPIAAHEFYDALIDVCTSNIPKNLIKQTGMNKLLSKLSPDFAKYVNMPAAVMQSVKNHLDMLSDHFFVISPHTYHDCKNMTPMELKLNRVIACADYEFSDLIHICSETAQCKIMNEHYLLDYQIERLNSSIELYRLNARNLQNRELSDEELAHERLEYIISSFPLRYHEALDDILDMIYDKFSTSEFFAMFIKKFDKLSINHEPQPLYLMHHNEIHCEFESCKGCEERMYTDNQNDSYKEQRSDVKHRGLGLRPDYTCVDDIEDRLEQHTPEELDELLKFCDTPENEQTRKESGYVDTDDVASSPKLTLDGELDPMSKLMLELVGVKLKAKSKEYIDDLISEVKSMLENNIDIEKWLNDEDISMERKLEVGYIIKTLGEDVEHKS